MLSSSYRSASLIDVFIDESFVTFLDPMNQWTCEAGYPLTALHVTLVSSPSNLSSEIVIETSSGGPSKKHKTIGHGQTFS